MRPLRTTIGRPVLEVLCLEGHRSGEAASGPPRLRREQRESLKTVAAVPGEGP